MAAIQPTRPNRRCFMASRFASAVSASLPRKAGNNKRLAGKSRTRPLTGLKATARRATPQRGACRGDTEGYAVTYAEQLRQKRALTASIKPTRYFAKSARTTIARLLVGIIAPWARKG